MNMLGRGRELAAIFVFAMLGVTLMSLSTGEAGEDAKAAASNEVKGDVTIQATKTRPSEKQAMKSCTSDPVILEDMKKRADELDARAKAIEAREAELAIKDRALEEELKRLQNLRNDIETAKGALKKENEEKVAKLVSMVETMSPKAAARMVAEVDEGLAVAAMSRMTTVKLAKIMNVMEPAKSAKLAELLAGTVRAERVNVRETASNGVASDGMKSLKGGDNKNGHVE